MKEIYGKEEIILLSEYLGFKNEFKFKAFIYNFNDYWDITDEELSSDEIWFFYQEEVIKRFKEIQKNLGIGENFSDLSLEEKFLAVIEITKKVGSQYLSKYFKGKIDENIAEKLVEYGYLHGSCDSLSSTLCSLFEEGQVKRFKVASFGHQCVLLNGKYYDITGCSTEEEMKAFVAKEGNTSINDCTIQEGLLLENRHKLIDRIVTRFVKTILLNKEKNPPVAEDE